MDETNTWVTGLHGTGLTSELKDNGSYLGASGGADGMAL